FPRRTGAAGAERRPRWGPTMSLRDDPRRRRIGVERFAQEIQRATEQSVGDEDRYPPLGNFIGGDREHPVAELRPGLARADPENGEARGRGNRGEQRAPQMAPSRVGAVYEYRDRDMGAAARLLRHGQEDDGAEQISDNRIRPIGRRVEEVARS